MIRNRSEGIQYKTFTEGPYVSATKSVPAP